MKGDTFKIGNTTIIIRGNTPNEVDIKNCYDICNELFRGNKDCFYTKKETTNKNFILTHEQKKEVIS